MIYDVIVLGIGSMGAATCWQLSKQGLKVLGIEQFEPPHSFGSHGGQSRLVRKAYFEHPDYVPLLECAYDGWDELGDECGKKIFQRTGLLYYGPPDHRLITGVLESAEKYAIPVSALSSAEASCKFPVFSIPDNYVCLLEPDAGFVSPEQAISAMVRLAKSKGVEVRTGCEVYGWFKEDGVFQVQTSLGIQKGRRLVITAGCWTRNLVKSLKSELKVTRQILAWVMPRDVAQVSMGNLPCWTIADPKYTGIFYGFPYLPEGMFPGPAGFKLAHHAAGEVVENPAEADKPVSSEELGVLNEVLDRYFPNQFSGPVFATTCRYTNTKDEDFILDWHPDYPSEVAIAAGFSGHGFKFAPAIGQIMAEMVTRGQTQLPISFLSTKRLG